jgi:hypothetical protein
MSVAPSLLANTRLGFECLQGTSTLAFRISDEKNNNAFKYLQKTSKISQKNNTAACTLEHFTAVITSSGATTLSKTAQHNNIQHNDTQHNDTQHNDTQHNDTQHNNTQHNDTQHNDTQHNDTQHNDTQHNDTQHNDTA